MSDDKIIELYNKGKKRFYLERLKTLLIILFVNVIAITLLSVIKISLSIFKILYENSFTLISLIIIISVTFYFLIVPEQWSGIEAQYNKIK